MNKTDSSVSDRKTHWLDLIRKAILGETRLVASRVMFQIFIQIHFLIKSSGTASQFASVEIVTGRSQCNIFSIRHCPCRISHLD